MKTGTIEVMRKLNQNGLINPLLIPLILVALVMIGTSVTTYMYYSKYADQRDNVNKKVSSAVEIAQMAQKKKLDSAYAEQDKIPYKTYTTPSVYGSVKLTFPKTYSSFVNDTSSTLDFYAHTNYVASRGVNYALRMSVADRVFASEIKTYEAAVKKGDLKASSISVAGVTGTRLDGLLKKDQTGIIAVFPLRDKVLKVWTENLDYKADFEQTLKTLTFSP